MSASTKPARLRRALAAIGNVRAWSNLQAWKAQPKSTKAVDGKNDKDKQLLLDALRNIEGRDRLGLIADIILVSGFASARAGLSFLIATLVGFTSVSFLGWVAAMVGITIFVIPPIGLILLCGLVGGLLGLVIRWSVRSGKLNDETRKTIRKEIKDELARIDTPRIDSEDHKKFVEKMITNVDSGLLGHTYAARVVAAVETGAMKLSEADRLIDGAIASRRKATAE